MSIKKLPFFLFFLIASCSLIDGYKTDVFPYHEQHKSRRLVIKIPKGFAYEKHVLDTSGGKEQFYYYSNGALLYFTKNVSWPTENAQLVSNDVKERDDKKFVSDGMDKDGLFWKEVRMEDFRFGYSYVPAQELGKFEQALNSIRVR